jgi:DNA adenine methylase
MSKTEFINDINGELSNFFRVVRERPLELLEKLRFRVLSKEDFIDERSLQLEDAGDEVARAARFYWLSGMAFSGKDVGNMKASFRYSIVKHTHKITSRYETRIMEIHHRLRTTYIFNEDFRVFISRIDRPRTFFYCDPPYYGVSSYYAFGFERHDHEELAELLRNIKGKFLLSYDDTPEVREMYSWANIEEVETSYSMEKLRNRKTRELLISNYDYKAEGVIYAVG